MGNTSQGTTGIRLWLILWRTARAIELRARHSIKETGLCLSDFGILEALLHKGALPVGALASKILISSGSLTAAVDRLEQGGLVERREVAHDRRSKAVHLTPEGRDLIERLFEKHASDMEEVFRGLDQSERSRLASLLSRLRET